MHRYQCGIDAKRAELETEKARLEEWEKEGFTAGVELVKKGIKSLEKAIRELESY